MTSAFRIAEDAVDPEKVPGRTTSRGDRIPVIGLGTFGSDHIAPDQIASAVREGISLGYRHIDCASVYGNEAEIGNVLSEVLESQAVSRDELWVTSKLWNNMHGDGDVLVALAQSLRDLGLEYLDLYLIHWPLPNHHDPGVSVDARHPDSVPYRHDAYMRVWRQMERIADSGLARHIGTSNMTVGKLERLIRDCRIKPTCNEMEIHPHFQQPELFEYCNSMGIVPIAYSPLGSPGRPARDTTSDDTVDLEDEKIMQIANTHGIHPAEVCIKWAVQRGQIPIPMSTKRRNLLSNLRAVTGDPLTDDEMTTMASVDRNCRLIKGQVFLWPGSVSWEEIWDEQ
jgi:diketogulonate reductase-like aldo/keto reductase